MSKQILESSVSVEAHGPSAWDSDPWLSGSNAELPVRTFRAYCAYTTVVHSSVTVTSTEFRKDLFQLVERALRGELIEIKHKGQVVKLVPAERPTKLSRLIPRDTIKGALDDLDRAQRELDQEMRASWDEKWRGEQ